ncbi:MAG: carboxypeptidase regulatory-like domain-containing protein [Vicinamibacterales bacterium]
MRTHHVRLVLAGIAAALVLAVAAPHLHAVRNGSIMGRVDLRRAPVPTGRRPGVTDLGTPAVQQLAERQMSVVYLETAPRGAFEQTDPRRVTMDQRNETFVPHVLAITAGTTVDFPNSDHLYHNVFSLSKTRPFDLGRYAAGRSKSVKFDRPGIVRVFCDIHSHMSAFILVFSHPFFSVTDATGRYHIDDVPPGSYTLVAWNEGVSSASRVVVVPDGAAAEADFTLR